MHLYHGQRDRTSGTLANWLIMKSADDESGREFDGNQHNDAADDEAKSYRATHHDTIVSYMHYYALPMM